MVERLKNAARHVPCASLLLAVPAVIIYVIPSLGESLQFERAAVDGGEW